MKPRFEKPGEDIIKQVDKVKAEVEDKIKVGVDKRVIEVEDKIKVGVDKRVIEILREREEKDKAEVDKRVIEILREREEKDKAGVDKRVIEILREREEKEKAEKAARLVAAVDKAKAIKGDIEREKAEKDNNVLCPTCGKGHVHKMESDSDKSGLVWKCNDGECDLEYVMVPKIASYKCTNCSMPINKPSDTNKVKDMSCPFCNGTRAVKFDWGKVWKTVDSGTKQI